MRKDTRVSSLLDDLKWRGLIAQTTDFDSLAAQLAAGPISLYCGFDPTAASLHVGNLVPLLTLRRFQQAGHRPIALVGGATGLIGDPSGRASERSLNSDDVVSAWVDRITNQVSSFVDLDGPNSAVVVSNLDWTQGLSAISFLREIGKHFSVNVMLSKESVRSRLEDQGISFTEFSYMLLQAYDYLELFRKYQCRLQIGGSDQWGNIVAGLDLIRRVEGSAVAQAFALTVPLVTKSDGAKFGKTADGAIWLDAELTSPYAFYQFWLNTDDRDVSAFLRMFSMRPPEELMALEKQQEAQPATRVGQRALADELTTLVHGQLAAEQAAAAGRALFGVGSLSDIAEPTVAAALVSAPHGRMTLPTSEATPSIVDLLVLAGLCETKGAARRVIKEGGAYLNNVRVTEEAGTASVDDLIHGRWWLLRRGKRTVGSVEVSR